MRKFILAVIYFSMPILVHDARANADEQLASEYAKLEAISNKLSQAIAHYNTAVAEFNKMSDSWNAGTLPEAIDREKALTNFNAWAADHIKIFQDQVDAHNSADEAEREQRKEAFDELQKKFDALNEKIIKHNADVDDQKALADKINNFVDNLNKIAAEANNPANAPDVRDQLKSQITQLEPELDQMKQSYSDTHDRIVEDEASINKEQDALKSENDDLSKKYDTEEQTLDDEKEKLAAANAELNAILAQGSAAADAAAKQIQDKFLAKRDAMLKTIESERASLVNSYSSGYASLSNALNQILAAHKAHPEQIFDLNPLDTSFPGVLEIKNILDRIAQLQKSTTDVVLSKDEQQTLKLIMNSDQALQVAAKANIGLEILNKVISEGAVGPVKLAVQRNAALIKGWRKANEAMVKIAKPVTCGNINTEIIEDTPARAFWEHLYDARGCND
jgi:chromosome segregation ATPase